MNNSGISIYKKLVDFNKTKIINQELPPDSKMDSIVCIMSRHDVSRDTAKRTINELSKEGYVRKIIELKDAEMNPSQLVRFATQHFY